MIAQRNMERGVAANEAIFFTVEDIMAKTGWGEKAVLNMFNDPEFPSLGYGKHKVVENHALIEFCSVRRSNGKPEKSMEGDLCYELKKRVSK